MGVFGKPEIGKKNESTKDKLFGRSTIYSGDGTDRRPYMTRFWFGRLRFHIFHRGDLDPDHHDHPWGFWTFPFTSYVEEYLDTSGPHVVEKVRSVKAWRLHWRPAEFAHKVLGREAFYAVHPRTGEVHTPHPAYVEDEYGRYIDDVLFTDARRIYTLVLRQSGWNRKWGFWKQRDGKLCWMPWKQYVNEPGAKDAPCS